MTREESLSIITEAIEDYVCNYVTDTAKAQKMLNAIQTLQQEPKYCDRNICLKNEYNGIGCDECEVTKSQEPSGDLISRQAVNNLQKYRYNCGDTSITCISLKSVNELPPVNPQEPCEDAISRQEVLDLLEDTDNGWIINEVSQLPSVKPQEPKTKQFAKWVATEIFDDMWEYNQDAFAEIACRKLEKLGIVRAKGDEWELVEPQERSE